jgi:preprotein translocase subunit SecG
MLDSVMANIMSAASFEVKNNTLIAFLILMALASVAIIVVVMMQRGTNDNVGVIAGASDTYYGKHKDKSKEGILKKVTLGLFVFIVICAIIFALVNFLLVVE